MAVTGLAEGDVTCTVSSPSTVTAGDTIQSSVRASGSAGMMNATVRTNGLAYVDSYPPEVGDSKSLVLMPAGGLTDITYTFTVTAQAGERAGFAAPGIHCFAGNEPVYLPNAAWSAAVAGTDAGYSTGREWKRRTGAFTAEWQYRQRKPQRQFHPQRFRKHREPRRIFSRFFKYGQDTKYGDAAMDPWLPAGLGTACAVTIFTAGKKILSR